MWCNINTNTFTGRSASNQTKMQLLWVQIWYTHQQKDIWDPPRQTCGNCFGIKDKLKQSNIKSWEDAGWKYYEMSSLIQGHQKKVHKKYDYSKCIGCSFSIFWLSLSPTVFDPTFSSLQMTWSRQHKGTQEKRGRCGSQKMQQMKALQKLTLISCNRMGVHVPQMQHDTMWL